MAFKVGCDPEVFVRNPNNGQFVNAHNMIPGDKKNPHKVPFGAVQVDGMALEFNIEPAETSGQFLHNVKSVYNTLQGMVPGYELVNVPTAEFGAEYMAVQPEESLELGCEPDYNAYTGLENPRPNAKNTFRTASGHVHIGWTEGAEPLDPAHFADCIEVVKQLDWSLGLMSRLWDPDEKRRSMYGDLGAFRPKSYGVEYRTMSNAWLNDDALIEYIFDQVQLSMEDLSNGVKYHSQMGSAFSLRRNSAADIRVYIKRSPHSCRALHNLWTGGLKKVA